MPPMNEKRWSEDIRRWKRTARMATRPALSIRDGSGDESDENASPATERSELRFTLETKRDSGGDGGSDGEDGDHNGRGGGRDGDRGPGLKFSASEETGGAGNHDGGKGDGDGDLDSDPDHKGSDRDNGDESDDDEGSNDNSPPPTPIITPTSAIDAPIAITTTDALTTTTAAPVTSISSETLVSTTASQTPASSVTTPISTLTPVVVTFTPIGVDQATNSPKESTFSITSSILTTLTTTPLDQVNTFQPQKGIAEPTMSSDTITAFPIFATASPTVTGTSFGIPITTKAVPERDSSAEQDNNDNGDRHGNHRDRRPPGLDPLAEHLLIAAGAIGAFILFCFIGWVAYRTMKKPRGARFPWRRKDAMGAAGPNSSVYPPNEPPPVYDKGELNDMQAEGFYSAEKIYSPGPGSLARSATGSSQRSVMRQPQQGESTLPSVLNQYPADNGATLESSDANLTLRSRMPDPFYNQSELARQPSDAYNPGQRQVYRASELSSISSGFGDGEIIVPPPLAVNNPTPPPPAAQTTNHPVSRFSWMTRSDRSDERRDTVYTTSSEDRPARFRTVTSWVEQQTGRVKRAHSRALNRGEVPVMPAIPGQISATQQTAYR